MYVNIEYIEHANIEIELYVNIKYIELCMQILSI